MQNCLISNYEDGRDLGKKYKERLREAIGNGGPMQRVNYQISLHPPQENRNIERRVREKHQKISGEIVNLEGTKDVTNKMRDMSKRPNLC